MSWDFFISHSSEDKPLARELAFALVKRGKRVWFDEFMLTAGDSLRRSIDFGLIHSRFGIVILSHNFFAKEWPKKELDALVARDDGSEKVIIPIWHLVQRHDVLKFSPTLADKLAIDSKLPIEEIVRQIFRAFEQEYTEEISFNRSVIIIGGTGSGKTSLSRKLLNQPLMYTLDNGYIERTKALIYNKSGQAYGIEYHIISYGDRSDKDFIGLVSRLANAVDIVLWVLNANSRAIGYEHQLLDNILNVGYSREKIIIAFNQVDLIASRSWDDRLWNEEINCPTLEQQEAIDRRIDFCSQTLDFNKELIIPTSVDREYGIDKLRDALLSLL